MTTLLLTGASSGLGAALARHYAAPGMIMGLVGRSAQRLEIVAADCRAKGAEVICGFFDVSEPEPFGRWLLGFDHDHPIDLLIANAGTSAGPLPNEPGEGVTLAAKQVRSNLLGAIHTVEPLLPRFASRKSGKIAVVASIAGLRGLPDSPGYCASKAGVRAYGEALRARLRPHGIHVTVVAPGFFSSPMTDRFIGDHPGLKTADQVAALVARALERRQARVSFPRLLVLGLTATDVLPGFLGDFFLRRFRFHIRAD